MKLAIGVAAWIDSGGTLVPTVPAAWDVTTESGGWCSIFPLGRARPDMYVHARAMAVDGANAAFAIAGGDAIVDALAARCARVWTIAELRADGGAVASRVKAGWSDLRESDGAVTLRATIAGRDYPALTGD